MKIGKVKIQELEVDFLRVKKSEMSKRNID